MEDDGQVCVPFDKRAPDPNRFTDNFHEFKPFHDFFPDDAQLHFRQPVTHTAMYTEPERQVLSWFGAIDDKFVW